MDYKISTINGVCSVVTDGSHYSPKSVDEGCYMVSVKDFTEYGFDFSGCRKISEQNYEDLKKAGCIPEYGDILVGKDGARYFEDIIIYRQPERPALLSSIAILRCNKDEILPEYLYYLLKTPEFKKNVKDNYGSGSAIPRIILKDFKRMPVQYPALSLQKKIVSVLEAIDAKIQTNSKINDNLQKQAQAIYREWFISRLEDHTDQYRKVSLADLMDYAGGSQPPASEFISEQRDGYVRFVQIRDYESDSHITYIPISGKNKICEEHDIMIARYGAALGRICFGLNGAYNVALAKVFPKQKYYREFLRCYLSSREFYEGINNKGGRSAQAGFNQSDIRSFEVFIPRNESIIKSFESLVAPIFEKRLHIIKENQSLAAMRDALLPKLMSGEVDVSAIQI